MTKGRFLYEEKVKDHPNLAVYGLFSTSKVEWRYFVISCRTYNNKFIITTEVCSCSYEQELGLEGVSKYGKEFKTIEDAKNYIQIYKAKWESGSNNTTQEVRDKKINDILDSGK